MEKKKKSSENDQLTGQSSENDQLTFQSFFLISPEQTVKLAK